MKALILLLLLCGIVSAEQGYFIREGYKVGDEFPRDKPDSIIESMSDDGTQIIRNMRLYRERKYGEDAQLLRDLGAVLKRAVK